MLTSRLFWLHWALATSCAFLSREDEVFTMACYFVFLLLLYFVVYINSLSCIFFFLWYFHYFLSFWYRYAILIRHHYTTTLSSSRRWQILGFCYQSPHGSSRHRRWIHISYFWSRFKKNSFFFTYTVLSGVREEGLHKMNKTFFAYQQTGYEKTHLDVTSC